MERKIVHVLVLRTVLIPVVAVVLALLLRVALAEHSITLPTYITFYPVVFLAAVLGGIWEGFLATALSALMAAYFRLPLLGVSRSSRPPILLAWLSSASPESSPPLSPESTTESGRDWRLSN